ncbi:hypothetical protein FNV43_RR13322 [Rhamnella rubrinervis]|uniref:Aconitase/3-isopropylmalate dehydratase large subunit alpha/beta/alpha domain-containing protein n=1 Tax=Rhamnella rubrinervis TaxID=2594499 RepID=A0A8K0MF15_9ROSA|nr:hypothetical protein FNV43_RR13322 [Rhamnella rubrinervis]
MISVYSPSIPRFTSHKSARSQPPPLSSGFQSPQKAGNLAHTILQPWLLLLQLPHLSSPRTSWISLLSVCHSRSFRDAREVVPRKLVRCGTAAIRAQAGYHWFDCFMTMTKKILVWNQEKLVIIPDHYIFTSDEHANCNVDILRDFCTEQNIKYFYDIKDLEGHCKPGEVLLGADSHTCTAGAFGQFATGIGNTDAGFVMGTGKLLLKVPPTLRFVMDGEMPDYLLAKDLILQIIGETSVADATYKAMEFVGTTVESLTMEEGMTVCNMVVEAGGKNGVVPADSTTYKCLEVRAVDHQKV